MNVIVISHTYISAINRDKWKTLANANKSLNIFVIIPEQWPTHFFNINGKIAESENNNNCHFIALPTYAAGNEVRYIYKPFALLSFLKKIKPAIIHVEQGSRALSYFQIIVSCRLLGIKPAFCFFTWINWHNPEKSRLDWLWRLIEKFNLKNSDGAIAGNNDAKIILNKAGLNKPITVLPQLGINRTIFKPATVHTPSQTIIYAGRLVEEKGVLLLLQAFISLHKKYPTWKLIFVGSGPLEKKLIDKTISAGLLDSIEFKPPVHHAQVAQLLQQAALLVLPSLDTPTWKEQFGHVLIEAMACKIPVLGSSAGEIPHVINNQMLIFEQGNKADLEKKLDILMANDQLRISLGAECYERTIQEYTHEVIGHKTEQFWIEILKNNKTTTKANTTVSSTKGDS